MNKKDDKRPFIGREYELSSLEEEFAKAQASLVVMYGRRRIGKTRLLREFCRGKPYYRFEGLEKGGEAEQIAHFLRQMSEQAGNSLLTKISCPTWREAFEHFSASLPRRRKHIVIFDEFPWMIAQDENIVALCKYYWDNRWSENKNLMLVLCGSINAFMVKKVIFSSAFYGRINREIRVHPLNPREFRAWFGPARSTRELADLYMVFGGVPRYLEEINAKQSAVQNVNRLCFCKDAFFTREFNRLFKDEFGKINVYAAITEILSAHANLNNAELMGYLDVGSGGGYSAYLENLKLAGFVDSYTPLRRTHTQLKRYRIVDEFLLFYFGMMSSCLVAIAENTSENLFLKMIGKGRWAIWAGFAFERFCIKQVGRIQEILKIDQLVKNYGSYFTRRTDDRNGMQIDLMFERHDRVITVCEIKYCDKPVGTEIIPSIERKIGLLRPKRGESVEKILICSSEPAKTLREGHYFNRIIGVEELF